MVQVFQSAFQSVFHSVVHSIFPSAKYSPCRRLKEVDLSISRGKALGAEIMTPERGKESGKERGIEMGKSRSPVGSEMVGMVGITI